MVYTIGDGRVVVIRNKLGGNSSYYFASFYRNGNTAHSYQTAPCGGTGSIGNPDHIEEKFKPILTQWLTSLYGDTFKLIIIQIKNENNNFNSVRSRDGWDM